MDTDRYDTIIIGSGLSGLSCGFELVDKGNKVLILESRPILGGRTSSWVENGMYIESGLHRYLGFYHHLPKLLRRAGIKLSDVLIWEDELEVRLPSGERAVLGASLRRPIKTLSGALGNNHFLSWRDKFNFLHFVAWGLFDYFFRPEKLDRYTVGDYARKRRLRPRVFERLIIPFTEGVFFLPADRYSAYALFGLLGPYLPYLYKMGLGAFKGGMTEVLVEPLVAAIKARGGEVLSEAPVEKLLVEEGRVVGVVTDKRQIKAKNVVLATSLAPAQEIIRASFADTTLFDKLLSLPSMPAVTIQIELPEPSTPIDRITFGPRTSLISFAEQSRTTFSESRGRVSIDLSPPEEFIKEEPDYIFNRVREDAQKIGIDLSGALGYRIVRLPADFYLLAPGSEKLRPGQATLVPGLTLCGDYTKQKYLCTMEGAVYSGKLAAGYIL